MHWGNPCGLSGCRLNLKPIGNLHNRLLQKEARDTSEAKQTRGKTWSSRVPAGNTCSGHGSGPVLWCMQGVQLDHFIGSSYIKSTLICHPLCLFMWHAGGGTLSFYRPWLLPEQACIEANHVAGLVANVIWNQLGIHIGSGKKKPEFLDAWNTVETL